MCERENDLKVMVKVPADLSHTGKAYFREFKIDACIAPIVEALQRGGIDMRSSCCGHGNGPGEICLQDGRILVLKEARQWGSQT